MREISPKSNRPATTLEVSGKGLQKRLPHFHLLPTPCFYTWFLQTFPDVSNKSDEEIANDEFNDLIRIICQLYFIPIKLKLINKH